MHRMQTVITDVRAVPKTCSRPKYRYIVVLAGDGSISFDEFRQLLHKYRSSTSSSSKRGSSGIKEVSRDTANNCSSPASSCASECDLRETFDIFDKDTDGYLNAVDLRSVNGQWFCRLLNV